MTPFSKLQIHPFLRHIAWILFSAFIFINCKTTKSIQQTNGIALEPITVASLTDNLAKNEVDATWLNAKVKIVFQDEIQTQKYTSIIRLRKDSVIWMNIKKFSVEGARVLIDKDSVYIINRLDKEYYVKSLDFLTEEYHLPADFDALQTIILGNPYHLDGQTFTVKNEGDAYQLVGEEQDGVFSNYWVDGMTFLLRQMSFLDLRNNRQLTIGMEEYQTEQGFTFSHKRNLEFQSERTGTVTVQFKFVEVERNVPKKMPFSISSRYKRVD